MHPMEQTYRYRTPEGFDDLLLRSADGYLCGIDFIHDERKMKNGDEEIFRDAIRWLDIYFSGRVPDFIPAYRLEGLSGFRKEVTEIMLGIPYGKTLTYSEIADRIARKRGIRKMAAQAVGGAVGANPLSIIIPCHRVVGKGMRLTGYGGGLKNKIALLRLEGIDVDKYRI